MNVHVGDTLKGHMGLTGNRLAIGSHLAEVGMLAGIHQLHCSVDTGSYLAAAHQKVGQVLLKSLVLSIQQ